MAAEAEPPAEDEAAATEFASPAEEQRSSLQRRRDRRCRRRAFDRCRVELPADETRVAFEVEPPVRVTVPTPCISRCRCLPSRRCRTSSRRRPNPRSCPGREPAAPAERGELARVDADLLDNLLNNAGEVSIFRSRIEQQISSIEFNLAELDRTVTRLKEQLRKLELETEAQILHRTRGDSRTAPTSIRSSSIAIRRSSSCRAPSPNRSATSASIEGLLDNLTRETQNLLLQQGRVVTEVQNGLMRTRMVPFQRHVQRLTRLVRQVATETGKKAELVVEGASGELDRQVLERMLPPFEHMLRNAVVHGIETPAERLARGKPETGRITMRLQREGAEVVIVVEDDGAGLNVAAIRAKARQMGLLQSGQELTDEEALQLILEPGFSTADRLTQQAGRGVGMDVVATEVKKLGGALFIESKPGVGARFTIRLPFTLAITQALIVRVHDELFALPLATVEGVARLHAHRKSSVISTRSRRRSNTAARTYRFQHLGAFVGSGPSRAAGSRRRDARDPGAGRRAFDRAGHRRAGRQPRDRRQVGRPADRGHPRHLRRDDPRRRPHRHHSRHRRAGALRVARAAGRQRTRPSARRPHLRAGRRRFDHRAPRHAAPARAQRHARDDGEGRRRRAWRCCRSTCRT